MSSEREALVRCQLHSFPCKSTLCHDKIRHEEVQECGNQLQNFYSEVNCAKIRSSLKGRKGGGPVGVQICPGKVQKSVITSQLLGSLGSVQAFEFCAFQNWQDLLSEQHRSNTAFRTSALCGPAWLRWR